MRSVVAELRHNRNMTQDEFAEFCGLSRPSIARYEANGRPNRDAAQKIAVACGVSVDFILGIKQDPQPQKPEVKEFIALAESLTPQSRQLALTYLQALHDAEHANTPKP